MILDRPVLLGTERLIVFVCQTGGILGGPSGCWPR